METQYFKNISNYFVAGINYKKSDASIRGKFAISNDQYSTILELASVHGLSELFILSTCNRTEIYGFAHNSNQLVDLLCSQTVGDAETFKKVYRGYHVFCSFCFHKKLFTSIEKTFHCVETCISYIRF